MKNSGNGFYYRVEDVEKVKYNVYGQWSGLVETFYKEDEAVAMVREGNPDEPSEKFWYETVEYTEEEEVLHCVEHDD